MSRLMWKDMTGPMLLEEFAGAPTPTPRPDLPTDVTESVTVIGTRMPDAAIAPPVSQAQKPSALHGLSVGAEHTSRFLEGQKGWVGQVGKFAEEPGNFGRVAKGLGRAGAGLSIAGEALGAADDYRNGAPLKDVVPGAVLHGGAGAAAGAIGAGLLSPLGPLGMAAGGIIGSYLADKYLPERKIMGEHFNALGGKFKRAMEESAERPYYHGPS